MDCKAQIVLTYCRIKMVYYDLWIATEDGLSRFNGTQFTAIKQKDGLSNDLIHDLETYF